MSDDGAITEPPPEPNGDSDCTSAMLAHIGGFLLSFILPLILLVTQTDRRGFVATHAREALNFQITLFIYAAILSALGTIAMIILMRTMGAPQGVYVGAGITLFLAFVMALLELLVVILASMAAMKGQHYRYPLNIRMV